MALSPCRTRTDQQGRELVQHGTGLFPIACYHDNLIRDPVPWHWHDELEAAVVVEGTMDLAVGTQRLTIGRGGGFFVNSGVLHAAWDVERSGCCLHSAVFHPRLIGGSRDSIFWQNYVQPLLAPGAPQYVCFGPSETWHREALQTVEDAWQSCVREPDGYDLLVREAVSRLALLLTRHCPARARGPSEKALREESRVKQMLQFIEEQYASELNTALIAESAGVSESECLRCFRHVLGIPPIQYLRQFRVQKAEELLRAADWSVAEIGAQCGFQDASYFTKTFRDLKGVTPSEYRRRAAEHE